MIFGFIKKVFVVAMKFFSANALERVSMNHQECKIRTKIIDINNNKSKFYPFGISVNKCSGRCNNISDPYAKLCVSDVAEKVEYQEVMKQNI